MGNVIVFKNAADNDDVLAAMGEALGDLEAAADALQEGIVGIAMAGVWRSWSDQQPVGTILHIDGKMMSETGDPRIDRLCEVLRAMRFGLADLASYRRAHRGNARRECQHQQHGDAE